MRPSLVPSFSVSSNRPSRSPLEQSERCYQVRRDQIRGKTDFDIHPPEIAEAVRAHDRQVIEAGVPIHFEEVVPA
jgi:PAS fold